MDHQSKIHSDYLDKSLSCSALNGCGYCKRLKSQLGEIGITFREINVEEEIEYAGFVEEVNGGNRVVPTLLFSDGVALTNPSAIAVKDKLASLA